MNPDLISDFSFRRFLHEEPVDEGADLLPLMLQ